MMEPLILREKIILIFTNESHARSELYKGHFDVCLTTRIVRNRLGNIYSYPDVRKELIQMEKDGYLHKHDYYSRQNNTVWRWDK